MGFGTENTRKFTVKWLTFMLHIGEVPSSNVSPETSSPN
jgi:hypothetical protein